MTCHSHTLATRELEPMCLGDTGQFVELRQRRQEMCGGAAPALETVREVVLLVSSSRSGSTYLAELLRQSSALLHLQGEISPILRLCGLCPPESGLSSDELVADHARQAARTCFSQELGLHIGAPSSRPVVPEVFAAELTWRLAVQWPSYSFRFEEVLGWTRRALRECSHMVLNDHGALVAFHSAFLGSVSERFREVRTDRYDFGPSTPRAGAQSPLLHIIEEPPFILSRPWAVADQRDLASKPLILKSPSNAYRFEFFRALFPNARIRVLHLTRNPGATINGLWDGWRSANFHAYRMHRPLAIEGYVDAVGTDSAHWWKFDLSPGWQNYVKRRLLDVCTFQWLSPHRAVLDFVDASGWDYCRVRFEDLLGPARTEALTRVCHWLRLPAGETKRLLRQVIPPMMSTGTPDANRWRRRADIVEIVSRDPDVLALSARLGYGAGPLLHAVDDGVGHALSKLASPT